MHLATIAGIETVPHSLIRLSSGNLAYITKRIDREKKKKIHMEDMCQITERLTEDKYRGSHEQIAKAILKYSALPGLDVVNFYEQVLFSFLTGNADMHLKNFSLINKKDVGYVLAPAYDIVATSLVNPADDEQLALTLSRFRLASGVKKLARRGTPVLDLWEEYTKINPEGLKRTTFYRHYGLYKRRMHPSFVIEHKAGDKMFIDFTGEKHPYVDATTGEIYQ